MRYSQQQQFARINLDHPFFQSEDTMKDPPFSDPPLLTTDQYAEQSRIWNSMARQYNRKRNFILFLGVIGLGLLITSVVLFVKEPASKEDPTYDEKRKKNNMIAGWLLGGVGLCIILMFYLIYAQKQTINY